MLKKTKTHVLEQVRKNWIQEKKKNKRVQHFY